MSHGLRRFHKSILLIAGVLPVSFNTLFRASSTALSVCAFGPKHLMGSMCKRHGYPAVCIPQPDQRSALRKWLGLGSLWRFQSSQKQQVPQYAHLDLSLAHCLRSCADHCDCLPNATGSSLVEHYSNSGVGCLQFSYSASLPTLREVSNFGRTIASVIYTS